MGLRTVARFLRTVRYRKGIMVSCFLVSCMLGLLYYATATRYYASKAELLVLQTGQGVMDTSQQGSRVMKDLMPTYQKIMLSDVVVSAAIKQLSPKQRIDFKGVPRNERPREFRKNLVVHAARQTNVLELSYHSRDPKTAAATLNSLLNSYIEFLNKTHQGASQEILAIMTREKAEIERKLNEKEAELLALKSRSQTFIQNGDQGMDNVVVARVMHLNDELVKAQEETLRARALLAGINSAIRNGEDVLHHALTSVDSVGQEIILITLGIDNRDAYTLARLNESLLNQKSELHEALEKYGLDHPRVRVLQESVFLKEEWFKNRPLLQARRLQQLKSQHLAPQLQQLAKQRLEHAMYHQFSVRDQFEREKQVALSLNSELAKMEVMALDINRLRIFYDLLLERMKDIDLGKDKGVRTAIVSEPTVPIKAVTPNLSIVVVFTLLFGMGLGLGTVYVLDALDDRFRSPEELRLQLAMPVLAMISKMELIEANGFQSVHTFAHPNGPESEAFRTLRTAVEFSEGDTHRIVSTSTEPGDGKTTVTTNLAVAFAQAGKRTLLIDADMRRPGMSTLLGLRDSLGLSQVLRSEQPVAELTIESVRSTEVDRLDVLPCGPRPPNPLELLGSDRFVEILSWAETQYEQILIDAPPVLAVSDPAIIGRFVDGVVLVVRPDKDRRRMVIRANETLRSLGCNLVGAVVNHLTSQNGQEYSYGYGYGYGYGHDELDDDPALEEQDHDGSLETDSTSILQPKPETRDSHAA